MLKAIILDDDQIKKYKDLINEISFTELNDTNIDKYNIDIKDRKEEASYEFSRDNRGFTSKIKLKEDNLVFFTVPYDKGWSATVNGKEVEVEKVSNGLMAVKAEAGDNEIRFNYMPQGFKLGIVISSFSLIVLAIYIILCKKKSKQYC